MGRNAPVDPDEKWTQKDKLVAVVVIGIPVWLTIILSIIGDIDSRRTQERLNNRPALTWKDVLTPEQRKEFGLDRYDEMEQRLKSGINTKLNPHRSTSIMSDSEFDKEDYYDTVDYNGGLDGEYSDIDYHDIEDIYGD